MDFSSITTNTSPKNLYKSILSSCVLATIPLLNCQKTIAVLKAVVLTAVLKVIFSQLEQDNYNLTDRAWSDLEL